MTKIITKKEKGNNRHWKNFLDKKYLGSHNLEQGEEIIVTIEKFEGEELVKSTDGKDAPKMVLYFKENIPKMILNITNGKTLEALYGPHPDQWIGKQIQVFSTMVKSFGKMELGLRIRDVIPKGKVDNSSAIKKVSGAQSLQELRTIFLTLTSEERNDKEVLALTNSLKSKYAGTK